MKKLAVVLLVLALACVSIFAQGTSEAKTATSEKVLRTYVKNNPSTLDAWQNMSGEAQSIIAAFQEPLLRTAGKNGSSYEPGIATDLKSNDEQTVWTLTIRTDSKWADGTPITVDDIVYSFQRVVDPAFASPRAYLYYLIKNAEEVNKGEMDPSELCVKALNESTIEITTKEPTPYFMQFLRSSGCAPIQKAAGEKYGDLYGSSPETTVASGPFKLESWTADNSIVLVKNENYWDADNVKIDKIEFTITNDTNSLLGMYQTGELDILAVTNDTYSMFKDAKGFTKANKMSVTFIEFNPSNLYLSNIKIREAFSIAFDRTAFAENIFDAPEAAAYGLVPYGVTGLNGGDFREQQGNLVQDSASDPTAIARAQQLLAEGLAELGKTVEELETGFTIQCLESGKLQAQAIQAMWKENLGVEMPVQSLEIGVLLPMLMNGTFDCVIGGGQDAEYADPAGFMNFIYEEGKWDDPTFLALMEKVHTQTGDERIATWMEIEKLVLSNYIYIPQIYSFSRYVIADNVHGIQIWPIGYGFDYKYATID